MDAPNDTPNDVAIEYDDTSDEMDMEFDIQSLLDSMGISMKHVKYAVLIVIGIYILSLLS
jgi:hypothetical protein